MAAKKKTSAKPKAALRLTAEHRIAVLHGKEAHLRSLHTESYREALTEAFGEVETLRFAGAQATAAEVLDECRSYGLMQQHKLIIVDEADKFVTADTRPSLERYAASPVESASLLLRSETWRPGNLDKAIAKVGAVIKCEPLPFDKAATWAQQRSEKKHGARIEPRAVEALLERVGTDLGRIDSELAKLAAMSDGKAITPELVRESVGMTREEMIWSMQARLVGEGPETAVRTVREALGPSKHPEALVAFAMVDLARKLHSLSHLVHSGVQPFQALRQAGVWGEGSQSLAAAAKRARPEALAELLKEAVEVDSKSKSGQTTPAIALETLAVRFASL